MDRTGSRPGDFVQLIGREAFAEIRRCVHCGLCTSACPTYVELRQEADSPRGRIYLMHALLEDHVPLDGQFYRHLSLCLDCRSCESACPSGVRYSRILEPIRSALAEADAIPAAHLTWYERLILLGLFPYPQKVRFALLPVRLLQIMGVYAGLERIGLFRILPRMLRNMASLINPYVPSVKRLPEFVPAKGRRRARVALFVGCVADALFRHIHWATIRVLQENGCDVLIPKGQVCCGAIHYHAGSASGAKHLARQNIRSFSLDGLDAIIVNHAGCGAMLKEYPECWSDDPDQKWEEFSKKVRDINEFLADLGLKTPEGPIPLRATYHDACHLAHAQQIRHPPRLLLGKIPKLQLIPLPESELCCGSAGSYNLFHDDMATRLVRRKVDRIVDTGAQAVIASNAGCLLQIGREIRRRRLPILVVHPVELLDWSYRELQPPVPGFDVERRP